MNHVMTSSPRPTIPPDVREFAVAQGIGTYLREVIDLAQHAFPTSDMSVSLGEDAEDERHRYIAIDVAGGDQSAEALLAGQSVWSTGVSRICPPRQAVYFVLGWR